MALLPTLADLSDVEDRLGRDLTPEESRQADAMLRDASAVIRSYCRRDFTAGNLVARYRPRGDKVILPQRPITSINLVSAVTSFGPTEIVTALPFWSWVGGNEVFIGDQSLVINAPEFDFDDNVWIEVDYDYGFTEVPVDIVTVCANLVVRNILTPSGGLIDSETIGPYTARYSSVTSAGPLGLGEPDREILNRYRSTIAHTVELR